jgi:hypothetical protein
VNVARVIGPTVAAVVVDSVGIGWCFVVSAVSFLFVIASLLSLDGERLFPAAPAARSRGQVREGVRYAAGIPEIIRPLLMTAIVGTFTFEFEVSLPLLARDTFGGGAAAYSWLLGGFGAGAVVGGLYAAGTSRTGVAHLARAATGYAIAMGLLALVPALWTAVGASALVGLATITFLTTGNSTVQLAADPRFSGAGSWPCGQPLSSAAPQSARRSSGRCPSSPTPATGSRSALSPARPQPLSGGGQRVSKPQPAKEEEDDTPPRYGGPALRPLTRFCILACADANRQRAVGNAAPRGDRGGAFRPSQQPSGCTFWRLRVTSAGRGGVGHRG